jgi:hypothetical protein
MSRLANIYLLLLAVSSATSCARPFVATTPAGFLELDHQDSVGYDYRAAHPDGLVTSVRVIANKPQGALSFWSKAVENQMRQNYGYALLEKRAVSSRDGTAGEQLRFGHDEGQQPHLYAITIFADQQDIFILEQGGAKNLMEKHALELDAAVSSFSVRSGVGRFFSYRGR